MAKSGAQRERERRERKKRRKLCYELILPGERMAPAKSPIQMQGERYGAHQCNRRPECHSAQIILKGI